MKKIFIVSLLILSLFVLFNCNKKSKSNVNVKAEFSLITRGDYIEKLKTQINEWNIEFDKLIVKVEKLRGKTRLKADEQVSLIRIQRDDLNKILSEIQNSGDNAWMDLKRGADAGKLKINMAFNKANAEFK